MGKLAVQATHAFMFAGGLLPGILGLRLYQQGDVKATWLFACMFVLGMFTVMMSIFYHKTENGKGLPDKHCNMAKVEKLCVFVAISVVMVALGVYGVQKLQTGADVSQLWSSDVNLLHVISLLVALCYSSIMWGLGAQAARNEEVSNYNVYHSQWHAGVTVVMFLLILVIYRLRISM